jgi:hypothetical protein
VFAARVLEPVAVFEDGDINLSAGMPVSPPDQFVRQRIEVAFSGGIVIAIAVATHRQLEPIVAQPFLIVRH